MFNFINGFPTEIIVESIYFAIRLIRDGGKLEKESAINQDMHKIVKKIIKEIETKEKIQLDKLNSEIRIYYINILSSILQSILNGRITYDEGKAKKFFGAKPQSQIFISYSWKNRDIVDIIDNDWKSVGLTLIRDVRVLEFKMSIKEFMKRVNDVDYVLVLISDAYLKSPNCMYETLEMLEDDKLHKRILPIVVGDANITKPVGIIKYIKHWEAEITTIKDEINTLTESDKTKLNWLYEELNTYDKIKNNIDKFITNITSKRYLTWHEAKQSNYKLIFDEIAFSKDNILEEVIRIQNIKDKEEQEIALERISHEYPKDKYLLFLKAEISRKEGKFKKARALYEGLIQLYPDYAEAHYNLANLLKNHFQEHQQAKELFEKAIALKPDNAETHNNLANLLTNHFQDYPKAKELYEKAIALKPDYANAHFNLALLLYNQFNDTENARVYYLKAIELNPAFKDEEFEKLLGIK